MIFGLQRTDSATREQLAIINAGCCYGWQDTGSADRAPVGDLPFCEAVFGPQPTIKDFYPSFLVKYRFRHICLLKSTDHFTLRYAPYFVKDACHWKSPRLTPGVMTLDELDWYKERTADWALRISEPVNFTNEWRYYVANGKVVTAAWYAGPDEDLPAPELSIDWPTGFSGAVDFGRLDTGELALVEAHAPMACGWYGEDPKLYAEWLEVAWANRSYWLA